MTHYQKCKAHRPDRAYKSKVTSTIMREWIDWYSERKPASLNDALNYIYHQILPKYEEYRGPHCHQVRARIECNIRSRIHNELWYEAQHLQIHEVYQFLMLMKIDNVIKLCERALIQPKDRCNDEPLTGA